MRFGLLQPTELVERLTEVDTKLSEDAAAGADTSARAIAQASYTLEETGDTTVMKCEGDWSYAGIAPADADLREFEQKLPKKLIADTSAVRSFDTSGAWLIERLRRQSQSQSTSFEHRDDNEKHRLLVEVVKPDERNTSQRSGYLKEMGLNPLEKIGEFMVSLGQDLLAMCNIIGAAIRGSQVKEGTRRNWRINSIVNQLDHMALRAIPVIAVMSFLIGAIIAQQGAFQLKWFGEELLTVDLVSILLLREIGVLLTAVMVAGRTGSAITAELGMMRMREEIDALRVIGLNPVSILIFPRLIALIIALPMLTLLANAAGLAGAMVVTKVYVGISLEQFIGALSRAVDLSTLFAGLIKAPFMALIIGLVAAVEGLKVGGSAESLGQHTTSSVVRAIFAVIVMDGIFAIFYGAINY